MEIAISAAAGFTIVAGSIYLIRKLREYSWGKAEFNASISFVLIDYVVVHCSHSTLGSDNAANVIQVPMRQGNILSHLNSCF